MAGDSSFDELMAHLYRGDKYAAEEIFKRYVQRLIALARTRLGNHLQAKEDPDDVVQSVFRSFFRRNERGDFEIGNWDSMWSLLALITLRKCGNRLEYYHSGCREVGLELRGDESQESQACWEGIAREPTPSEAAVFAETLESLMRDCDECERSILSLRLQDYTIQEISDRVGRAERTVRRVLDRFKRRLSQMRRDGLTDDTEIE